MRHVKCVVVGDNQEDRITLLTSFAASRSCPTGVAPIIFDNFLVNLMFGDEPVTLGLFDIGGSESYDRLRSLLYPSTDVFIVCFSLLNRDSFESVRSKWWLEIKQHCPTAAIVLVATDLDLRPQSNETNCVSFNEDLEMSRVVGAVKCVECSIREPKQVGRVFHEALKAALETPTIEKDSKKRNCLRKFRFCRFI